MGMRRPRNFQEFMNFSFRKGLTKACEVETACNTKLEEAATLNEENSEKLRSDLELKVEELVNA